MTNTTRAANLLTQLDHLNEQQLRRLLVEHLTKQKLGLYWEANAIERDVALNADLVLPRLVDEWSCTNVGRVSPSGRNPTSGASLHGNVGLRDESANPTYTPEQFTHRNLIIEGDNYDALRLLRATHAGKIRAIYIDPPYNTGNALG